MQRNLYRLDQWARTNSMRFNKVKYSLALVSQQPHARPQAGGRVAGNFLEEEDLGLLFYSG